MYRNPLYIIIIGSLISTLSSCSESSGKTDSDIITGDSQEATYEWNLPLSQPIPKVPTDNPMSEQKVMLGRHLFFDRRLSINGQRSCADCHQPAKAFSDGLAVSIGITENEIHPRNAMSLTNVGYNAGFNWANPLMNDLETQAHAVLFNEEPIELGWSDQESVILSSIAIDFEYQLLFSAAFPDQEALFTVDQVIKALSSYQRQLISVDAKYDQHQWSDDATFTASELRGKNLFFGGRMECFHCHGGFNFSNAIDHQAIAFEQNQFHNTGLYNVNDEGQYPANNTGLWEFTKKPEDMGKFRPPTLRNIELTAPYMHDGSINTLREVIVDHYARGGRKIETGPYQGDGAKNPYKSGFVQGFSITEQETDDLINFLKTLTDWDFICRENSNDPFYIHPSHEHCNQ